MNDVIELEYVAGGTTNNIGEYTPGETSYKSVYAERMSIKQSEFYQAAAAGFKPELRFKINIFEYEENKRIRYKGILYKIIRTFESSLEKIELVCEGDIHGNS